MSQVESLLDRSIATEGYLIRGQGDEAERWVDLSNVDFAKLAETFKTGRKRTLNERLKGKLAQKPMTMVRQNRTRIDYLDRFQALIDAYNAGSLNAEAFFEQLVELAERLPDAYTPDLFEEKAGVVFQHVYETYYGGGGSVYAHTA